MVAVRAQCSETAGLASALLAVNSSGLARVAGCRAECQQQQICALCMRSRSGFSVGLGI